MKTEAGIRVLRPQPRKAGSPRSWKRQGRTLPTELREEKGLGDTLTLDFRPPEPQESTRLLSRVPPRVC